MAIDYKEIGSNIKVCRIRKKLKQAQLAEIVGVSSQHKCRNSSSNRNHDGCT